MMERRLGFALDAVDQARTEHHHLQHGLCTHAERAGECDVFESRFRRPVPEVRSLASMADQVHAWCERKGWEPDVRRTFGDECALIHSEISEALEAFRDHGVDAWIEDEDGEDVIVTGADYGEFKPEGVPSEFADVLVRLLHYSKVHGIDLQAEFDAKMAYNEGRTWRHGGRAL